MSTLLEAYKTLGINNIDQLDTVKTKDLLAFYNSQAERKLKSFHTRKQGLERVTKILEGFPQEEAPKPRRRPKPNGESKRGPKPNGESRKRGPKSVIPELAAKMKIEPRALRQKLRDRGLKAPYHNLDELEAAFIKDPI